LKPKHIQPGYRGNIKTLASQFGQVMVQMRQKMEIASSLPKTPKHPNVTAM
jgi:hypothetical protein